MSTWQISYEGGVSAWRERHVGMNFGFLTGQRRIKHRTCILRVTGFLINSTAKPTQKRNCCSSLPLSLSLSHSTFLGFAMRMFSFFERASRAYRGNPILTSLIVVGTVRLLFSLFLPMIIIITITFYCEIHRPWDLHIATSRSDLSWPAWLLRKYSIKDQEKLLKNINYLWPPWPCHSENEAESFRTKITSWWSLLLMIFVHIIHSIITKMITFSRFLGLLVYGIY